MKKTKILITGKNSYIGTSFMRWVSQWPDKYGVEAISVRGEEWKNHDFSQYDSILHVAGIAHVSAKSKMEQLYYKVNRDLAIEVAKKAKKENVKQFIFMSSIIIYGADGKVGESKVITGNTTPTPIDFYGKSKLDADIAIQNLNSKKFKTAVIRTPMVYGPNCKGNFPKLVKLAEKIPIFPNIQNQRSMIYIDHLSEFIRLIIDELSGGIFFPQNNKYVSTKEIVKYVAELNNKKIVFTNVFNPLIRLLSKKINYINKVFGNKVYDKSLSLNKDYNIYDFEQTIRKSI